MASVFVKSAIITGLAVLVLVLVLFGDSFTSSCSIKHINVVNDLNKYQENMDPELCDSLVSRIIDLNEQCGIEMDVIDCG